MSSGDHGALFPPQLHVFVRDWLSSNNVLVKSREGNVLIDSGYTRHAPLTLALLGSGRGLSDAPLDLLVNTHCHADHVGGNAAIVRQYGCPVAVPAGEAPLVERWDGKALLYDYCDQRIERFGVDRALPADTTHVWGDLEWQALAAPGHDMGALVFYNAEHRILISGDALWERGFGFVMPPEIDAAALPATRATIDMLARLDIRVVIPGHGEPFTGVAAALDRAHGAHRVVRGRQPAHRATRAQGQPDVLPARPAADGTRRHARVRRPRGPLSRLQRLFLPVAGGAARRIPDRRAGEIRRREARRRLARARRHVISLEWRTRGRIASAALRNTVA